MKRKTHVAGILTENKLLEHDSTDSKEFFNNRFAIFADNAQSCVISGSSTAHKNIAYTEPNLDAGETFFRKDKLGVVSAIHQSTADGLGDEREDPDQNEATRRAASAICESFCRKSSEQTLLDVIGDASKKSFFKKSKGHAALSGVEIALHPEKISCKVSNVGDTAIIVLGGEDFSIKHIIPPRVAYRGFYAWSPLSVQDYHAASNKDKPTEIVQLKTLDGIQPGDVFVQMTDGVWAEFQHETMLTRTSDDEIWMEYIFDEENLSEIIRESMSDVEKNNVSLSFQIAQGLLHNTIKKTIRQREEYQLIFESIQPGFSEIDPKKLLGEWLSELKDKNLAKKIKHFILESGHDGVQFTEEAPMFYIINWLEEISFGDCTTVSVLEVPDYRVELVRSLIEHPEHAKKILTKIAQHFNSEKEIESVLDTLAKEIYQPRLYNRQGSNLNDINFRSVYSNEQIQAARKMISNYFKIYNQSSRFYSNARRRVEIQKEKKKLSKELTPSLPHLQGF